MRDNEALAVREANEIQLGTLQASTPEALIAAASSIATPLKKMIRDQNLANSISGRQYVRCEGWTTMGAMLGVTPQEVSNVADANGVYVATVELINNKTGAVVGRASAECGAPDELDRQGKALWANRPAYARRSMAATRATSKAFRLSFSWIMTLAGYEATPAEEMPSEGDASGFQTSQEEARGQGHSRGADEGDTGTFVGPICEVVIGKEGKKANGTAWKKYHVIMHDSRIYQTFSETFADVARSICQRKTAATIEWKRDPKYRGDLNIESISEVAS